MDDLTAVARAAQRGDRAALEVLVRRAQADVWRYCAAMVGPDDADDVTQEALLRVVRALPSFRGDAPTLVWVLAVARRAALDWLRSKYRRHRLLERVRAEPARHAGADGWWESVELLGALDEERREAFVLTQLLGWSYAEAAETCGCPVGTIRSRVARARVELLGAVEAAELSEFGNHSDVGNDR